MFEFETENLGIFFITSNIFLENQTRAKLRGNSNLDYASLQTYNVAKQMAYL